MNNNVEEVLRESNWAVSSTRIAADHSVQGNLKKRKQSSPIQSEAVMRLKRDDSGCSPILRLRNITKKKDHLGNSNTGPPVVGSSKKKRKTMAPRRCYNESMKQLLITSSFSPKQIKKPETESMDGKN